MHTLDGHFACWTATTHTDKHGAASSQPICTTSARLTRGFAALHARQPAPEKAAMSFGGSHELRAQV